MRQISARCALLAASEVRAPRLIIALEWPSPNYKCFQGAERHRSARGQKGVDHQSLDRGHRAYSCLKGAGRHRAARNQKQRRSSKSPCLIISPRGPFRIPEIPFAQIPPSDHRSVLSPFRPKAPVGSSKSLSLLLAPRDLPSDPPSPLLYCAQRPSRRILEVPFAQTPPVGSSKSPSLLD